MDHDIITLILEFIKTNYGWIILGSGLLVFIPAFLGSLKTALKTSRSNRNNSEIDDDQINVKH